MKPLPKDKAEAALRGDDWRQHAALQRLPADVDATLAADVVLDMLGEGNDVAWVFSQQR
jgi:hypothetical protein